MFDKLRTVFTIPELRQKIFLTLILLGVYRMGFSVFLPFVDQEAFGQAVQRLSDSSGGLGQAIQVVALFSASSFGNATIFGLGIMPYISASIIFQLLGTVYPPLEQLQKEGEAGRKKINEWTRYATVVICLLQSFFWLRMLEGGLGGSGDGQSLFLQFPDENGSTFWSSAFFYFIGTITMTAGTVLLMWIGEQIDEYGIGNGISLLIMAGILAQMPGAAVELLKPAFTNGIALGSETGIEKLLLLAALFVGVIIAVVAMTQAVRRIPIQSAKHVRGRSVQGGMRQFLPLRVNQAGVMPIIFASSLLMFPYFIFAYLAKQFPQVDSLTILSNAFGGGRGLIYNLSFVGLIYFFCYFWTAITFNPRDIADNLKDYGSFIPGYRPGVRTSNYLESVMVRITYVGAAFLAIVAVIPPLVATAMNIPFLIAQFYGGTGLLIVVSVALDLVQKIDSHLVMRNQTGLLEKEAPA